jgi:hypothetical protein
MQKLEEIKQKSPLTKTVDGRTTNHKTKSNQEGHFQKSLKIKNSVPNNNSKSINENLKYKI